MSTNSNEEYLLEVKDLHTSFFTESGEVKAVNGVSFTLKPGEVMGIVGESGSGKSVTAYSIMQILADTGRIVGGQVLYRGQDLAQFDRKQMAGFRGKCCSIIFQDPMTSLNPVFTVGSQIMEAIRLHTKKTKEEAKVRAAEMLELVGVNEPERRLKQYPHELSGGMRQRVMIAMALACEPDILIADEPTTALDVTIQAQILNLMNELKREQGTSILFVTHDLGVINQMADDVAVMYCGQVVELAPASTLFDPKSEYSHPYTEGLMLSVPRLDTPAHQRLETIPGSVPHPLDLPKGCKFAPRCKYATDKCREQEPTMTCVSDKQQIRCFYPSKEERHGKAK